MKFLKSDMFKSSKFVQWVIGMIVLLVLFIKEYVGLATAFTEDGSLSTFESLFHMRMELIKQFIYGLFGGNAIYAGAREYGKNSEVAVLEAKDRLAKKETFSIPNGFTGIHIDRVYHPFVTLGTANLYVGGVLKFTFMTVELPWKNNQKRVSCIPAGTYDAVKEHSPKFGRLLIELKGVPNRSEIKFHAANYTRELEGCIAPGAYHKDLDGDGIIDVANSAKTHDLMYDMLPNECQVIITPEPKQG